MTAFLTDYKKSLATRETLSSSFSLNCGWQVVLKVLCASLFIGICAQIKIPLYFTPVPLSLQTAAIMLVGATLGSRTGALAVMFYLAQGLVGLPVFCGGACGAAYFVGPLGGYIMGYVVQAYVIGWFLERQHTTSYLKMIAVMLFSVCVQMGMGTVWLAQFIGIKQGFILGFCPFILGEISKCLFAAGYFYYLKK